MIRKKIIEIAKSYVGVREIGQNQGFTNKQLEKELLAIGWIKGQAYCAKFGQLVWSKAYANFDSTIIYDLNKLFTANAVKTYENFKKSPLFKTASSGKPEPGDLIIWASVKNDELKKVDIWTLGHLGISIEGKQLKIDTVEGNTNEQGLRTGNGIWEKERDYSFYNNNGLRLIGFVKPREV